MKCFIDIETIPQQPEAEVKAAIAETIQAPAQMSKPETIAEWHAGEGKYAGVKDALIEETYRRTALDGSKGEVISVAFAIEDSEPVVMFRESTSEADLLAAVFAEIKAKTKGRPPYFIGHNVGGFDLKFLFHRAVINRVRPEFDLCQWGRHGSNFYDTSLAWAGFGNRISQDNLCKALGIQGKPDDINGANVWDHFKAGNIKRISEYNEQDVETVRAIYSRLTFSDQKSQLAKSA